MGPSSAGFGLGQLSDEIGALLKPPSAHPTGEDHPPRTALISHHSQAGDSVLFRAPCGHTIPAVATEKEHTEHLSVKARVECRGPPRDLNVALSASGRCRHTDAPEVLHLSDASHLPSTSGHAWSTWSFARCQRCLVGNPLHPFSPLPGVEEFFLGQGAKLLSGSEGACYPRH